jgi:hypothetical protein
LLQKTKLFQGAGEKILRSAPRETGGPTRFPFGVTNTTPAKSIRVRFRGFILKSDSD